MVAFRGRELAHPHIGEFVVDRVIERCAEMVRVDAEARLDGRRMIALIGPKRATDPS